MWTSDGGVVEKQGKTAIPSTRTGASTINGEAYAMPGTLGAGAAVKFWINVGMEVPFTGSVSAGAVSSARVVADESQALAIAIMLPWWESGKPGSKVVMALDKFPLGRRTEVTGYTEDPESNSLQDFGTYVSEGDQTEFIGLTVPKSATPGYSYYFTFDNLDGRLNLQTYFQVATLKTSSSTIRRGGSVRLSGIVPTEGHWGSEVGNPKTVTIYQRQKALPNALDGDPYRKGWTKVGTCRANGLGRFLSGSLHPAKSTWYVLRYPSDNWYDVGYADPVRVTVK
jgi:hypothetical protein